MRKYITALLVVLALAMISTGIAFAGGPVAGIISGGMMSKTVDVSSREPISVNIAASMGTIASSDCKGGCPPITLDPGQSFIMNYEIHNASATTAYVLEVHAGVAGSAVATATIQNFTGDFAASPTGTSIHLLIPAGAMTPVQVKVMYPKNAPAGETAHVALVVSRTACDALASCPWG